MSPLVAAPNRGYADWQRVSNMDSGILLDTGVKVGPTTYTSPVIDVSRYLYLGGTFKCSALAGFVAINWWADAAGTIALGTRYFVMDAVVTDPAQVRFPNLGPFVQINFEGILAFAFQMSALLFGTNRYHPLEFIPLYPMLFNQISGTLNAGITTEIYPNDYYSGPVRFNVQSLPGQINYNVQAFWFDGNYKSVDSTSPPAGTTNYNTVVPGGFWKLVINNISAAQSTYIVSATPTFTGST